MNPERWQRFKEIFRTFLRERQIPASLDHPHTASLFDGGATPDDTPYFVMGLVAGVPITAYCRRHQLSVNGKLKLFRVSPSVRERAPVCWRLYVRGNRAGAAELVAGG
jgi:serine/threonine protein kinase